MARNSNNQDILVKTRPIFQNSFYPNVITDQTNYDKNRSFNEFYRISEENKADIVGKLDANGKILYPSNSRITNSITSQLPDFENLQASLQLFKPSVDFSNDNIRLNQLDLLLNQNKANCNLINNQSKKWFLRKSSGKYFF